MRHTPPTAYPYGEPEGTPGFSGIRVAQSSFMCSVL